MARTLGKGEVESSILSHSTINPQQIQPDAASPEKALCAGLGTNDSGTAAQNWHSPMWNPDMSAAPRDGTPFLVWGGHWAGEINGAEPYHHPMIVQTTNGFSYDVVGTDAYAAWVVNPTHWMALPATP